jgi:hypothetical protein
MVRRRWLLPSSFSQSQTAGEFTCCTSQECGDGVPNDPVTCAALGALWVATEGPTSWQFTDGWLSAANGTPTDYCGFFGLRCAAGVLTHMCVDDADSARRELSTAHPCTQWHGDKRRGRNAARRDGQLDDAANARPVI